MTPGPTPAPPEVLGAIGQPVIHHRGPDFRKLYAEVLGRLREVFRTEQEVLLFGGSGSGAMESAVANLCSRGDPVLVVSAGYFGERWAAIAKAYGGDLDHLRYSWGEIPSADDVAARLREREARETISAGPARSSVSGRFPRPPDETGKLLAAGPRRRTAEITHPTQSRSHLCARGLYPWSFPWVGGG